MISNETTLLPKLDGYWAPVDSRVRKSDSNIYNRYTGNKSSRKSTASPKRHTNNARLFERQKTAISPITSRSLMGKKDSEISIKRLIALNGSILDNNVMQSGKHEKLKIRGIGVNNNNNSNNYLIDDDDDDNNNDNITIKLNGSSPTHLTQIGRLEKRRISTTEILSPLLTALQRENTQGVSHYKKLLNRNTFLTAQKNTPPAKSAQQHKKHNLNAKPKLATRSSLDEVKLFEKKQEEKTVTIEDYLRKENARYASDEQSVKKVLFENWLHNIEIVDSSTEFSMQTTGKNYDLSEERLDTLSPL